MNIEDVTDLIDNLPPAGELLTIQVRFLVFCFLKKICFCVYL